MTNQFIPPCYLQNETKNDCNAPYYFSPGWMGFTPFAAIVLSCLIIPLFLAAIATYFCTPSDLQKKMERPLLNSIEIDKRDHDNEEEEEDERRQEIQQKKKVAIFSKTRCSLVLRPCYPLSAPTRSARLAPYAASAQPGRSRGHLRVLQQTARPLVPGIEVLTNSRCFHRIGH